jgi:hypothetical protein
VLKSLYSVRKLSLSHSHPIPVRHASCSSDILVVATSCANHTPGDTRKGHCREEEEGSSHGSRSRLVLPRCHGEGEYGCGRRVLAVPGPEAVPEQGLVCQQQPVVDEEMGGEGDQQQGESESEAGLVLPSGLGVAGVLVSLLPAHFTRFRTAHDTAGDPIHKHI